MTIKEINDLRVSRGINIAFRTHAAKDVTQFIEDSIILLRYRDNYTTYIMNVLGELGIETEVWARPYLCTDRYGNEMPYLTVYVVRKDYDTQGWSFLKRTAEMKRIDENP